MAGLSPARAAARALVSRTRRRSARVRDVAREDEQIKALSDLDRALAVRLSLGVTATERQLDELIDARLRRPSSVEPLVRDALRVSAFELCHLDTPAAVAASQGVELVRSVAPRAAGLANAVLRRLADEVRPEVERAWARCAEGAPTEGDLSLVSGLPAWLVGRLVVDRGLLSATRLCTGHLEAAPVCVAANGARHDAAALEALLEEACVDPHPIPWLPGAFRLGSPAPLKGTRLVHHVDLVVADPSAQLVCRLAAPASPGPVLEVGQGRGTKSVLLATAEGACHPSELVGVDSVPYKPRLSEQRMRRAGIADEVTCLCYDGRLLAGADLPAALDRAFEVVLLDAPCSGTGTMRRHPEIPAHLCAADVASLAELQLALLGAASARVAPGGTLVYATCSVLREEDEAVVEAFLQSPAGAGFAVAPVTEAPCCADEALARVVGASRTPEGFLLTWPGAGEPDGHFCARLLRTR